MSNALDDIQGMENNIATYIGNEGALALALVGGVLGKVLG